MTGVADDERLDVLRHGSSCQSEFRSRESREHPDWTGLWEAISRVRVPLMLVRGMRPQSVVDDADEAELLRRCPTARVEHVAEAGHSVQGDTPIELAELIGSFLPKP